MLYEYNKFYRKVKNCSGEIRKKNISFYLCTYVYYIRTKIYDLLITYSYIEKKEMKITI